MQALSYRNELPPGFLVASARELYRLLPGPTLVDLPGERPDPLFVSVLQHGNEDSGLRAIQRLLADYAGRPLPRALTLFIANPMAAQAGHRRLDGQPDFNRCWPGTDLAQNDATILLSEVFNAVRGRPLFASVDIHNTSGDNPVYACVNTLDPTCLQLAARFADTAVYFTRPRGLQAQAFLELCPAVVLECGRVGGETGVEAARAYLDGLLHSDTIAQGAPEPSALQLLRSIGLVEIRPDVHFSVGGGDASAEFALDSGIDRLNFRQLPAGTAFGEVRAERWPIRVTAPDGREISDRFFEIRAGQLRLKRSAMPSLLTPSARIIRQDCLCHLMERFEPDGLAAA